VRQNRALRIGIAIATIALGGSAYLGRTVPPAAPELTESSIARLFAARFDDSSGKAQPLAQWRGKTLVVNFWASWCPPCREEMPGFSRLQTKYAANNVQFVGIALDTADNVSRFAQQQAVGYPLLIGGAPGNELAQQLGNASLALPYTVVLGAAGDVRLARLGRVGEGELDDLLARASSRR
jgi:thiol-disulfide isomerase/thioredoxin